MKYSNYISSGMHVVYLPPYSPDYNPIEEGFSAMKAWLREHHVYAEGELSGGPGTDPYSLFWEAVYTSMTSAKAYGWYKHSHYNV